MNLLQKIPLVRTLIRQYALTRFKRQWRRLNRHNRTVAMNRFPIPLVSVGNGTYGELHIVSFSPQEGGLRIGHYVSIAAGVHFILNGNHQTRTLFTYPLRTALSHSQSLLDDWGKGPITVADEVWIGFGATILSGVTLGKGCIIAAGAVVSQDVPPYAIAAGNPARVVRYRLPADVIPEVEQLSLNDIPADRIAAHLDDLYQPLHTAAEARRLVNKLRGLPDKP